MRKQISKLALTAALGLAITFTQAAAATTLTDPRDKKTYKTVKIGEQVWMAENLNYAAKGSKCGGTDLKVGEGEGEEWYLLENKNTANCDKYGRLYDLETAMKACPSGWHLPTDKEWGKLYRFADGTSSTDIPYESATAGKFLKATSGWERDGNGEDKYGFAALPGGYGSGSKFTTDVGYAGYWWCSKEGDGNYVNVRYIGTDPNAYTSGNFYGYGSKSFVSVRCIKD